jgi:polar amino acid transport system substrate-binding protein
VDTARKSLLGKALARPDFVKKLFAKAKREGLWKAWETAADRLSQPMPLGYSCAGEVLDFSSDVEGFQRGDLVSCGGDHANHAEIVCVPKNLVVPIPKGVGTDAAAFATLGAIAMQGIRQADLRLGEKVAVIGLGLLGLLTVQMLRASGCRVLGIDVDPQKLALGIELGCDVAAPASSETIEDEVVLFTNGYGTDATIITAATSSNRPIEQAGELTREKGRVVVVGAVGLTVPREPYYHKEIDLRISRSYGPGRYDQRYEEEGQDYPYGYVRFTERRNMECFLELVQNGRVQLARMITHRFPLTDTAKAYELISGEKKEPYLGILLEYDRADEQIPRRIECISRPLIGNKITVGMLGAGRYATSYLLPAICRHKDLLPGVVCTQSGVTAQRVAQKFGFQAADSDVDTMISQSDAVVVATRHHDHADSVQRVLQKGKSVFVEKPLVINENQLEQVVSLVRESASGSLMVGFNRRFAPATVLARDFFESVKGPKQILLRINAGSIPRDHWIHNPKIGGGRLIGEACHFVDLAVALTGALVKNVVAVAIPQREMPAELWDNFSLALEMSDGSVATVFYTSVGNPALPKERIEIHAGERSAVIDDFKKLDLWKDGDVTRKNWWKQDKGQTQQIDAWVEGLKKGSSPIPVEEILNVHRACLAGIRSMREHVAIEI